MRLNSTILLLCCWLAWQGLSAQVDPNKPGGSQLTPPVNPNNTGGSQVRPKGTTGSHFAPVAPACVMCARHPRYGISSDFQANAPSSTSAEVWGLLDSAAKSPPSGENADAMKDLQWSVSPSSSGVDRMLRDGAQHVYVVDAPLEVVDATPSICPLSSGDVMILQSAAQWAIEPAANLVVLSSKGGQECAQGSVVMVSLSDLQAMSDHMRETIDRGIEELGAEQKKASVPPPFPETQPTPATIRLGQSPEQVKASLGPPSTVAILGLRVIYFYTRMKVTFVNGKVSNVE